MSPVMAWALCPGQSPAGAHSGSRALLPSLTWSHPPFLIAHAHVPFPWDFPRSFIMAVAALHQARFWHQWVGHAFLLPLALAGCWHPPWPSSTLGIPARVCCSPWLCLGSPQRNVPGGHGVFRKTGLGTCWPYQENKHIRAGSRTVPARGRHSINPLEQVLCSRHKEMSILFSLA